MFAMDCHIILLFCRFFCSRISAVFFAYLLLMVIATYLQCV